MKTTPNFKDQKCNLVKKMMILFYFFLKKNKGGGGGNPGISGVIHMIDKKDHPVKHNVIIYDTTLSL